jgi:dTDP-4-dehydrorhamnose 3,5-epimerase
MKILSVTKLAIPDVKVVRFARYCDDRGYFSEHFRVSDFGCHPELELFAAPALQQCNEAYSRRGTVRGLHFQWQPKMGKLVRPLMGRLLDFVLDIRPGSPSLGQIIGYDMPAVRERDYAEWIWVPPGFAHGTVFPEESAIEYFCTAEWNPSAEAGISPLAPDLDWSLCDPSLRRLFEEILASGPLMAPKDRAAPTLTEWQADPRAALISG